MASLLLALIYLAFISLGLPDSLLGSAWPVMHVQFGVPVSYAGGVSMLIAGGTIISSLLSDRITRSFGAGRVTVVSVFLTAAGLFGFSCASRYWVLCVFALPYGLGAGAIDAALNNYVALHYASRHMSWLHCFWGVGTIISPYIMSRAISKSVWNDGYRDVAFIQLGIALLLLFTLPVWKINPDKDKTPSAEENRGVGVSGTLKIPGVPYLLTGFFAYCAAEGTAMLWASSYLAGVRGVTEELAAAFGSLFFIGITAGRFAAGFVTDRAGDRRMIRIGTAILFIGICFIALPVESDRFALAGFVILGLGCAPIYPCIIHSTPRNFGAENSQAIIGIQMASAYVGSTFMPPLFGALSGLLGLELLPYFMAAFFALMAAMLEMTYKKTAGNWHVPENR